jgi:hypothetical protein
MIYHSETLTQPRIIIATVSKKLWIGYEEVLNRPRRHNESASRNSDSAHSRYRIQDTGFRVREIGIGFRIQEEETLSRPPGSVE